MKIMKIFNTYNCNLLKHFRINQFIKKNIFLRLHKNISHISTINSNNMGELNITKSIENLKIYHENKFACLLIECLYCNNKKLYVNKITGRFICTHCMRVGEWSSCEEYLQSHKNSKANFIPTPKIFEAEQYFKKISNTLIHFSALSVGTKKSILKALDVEGLKIPGIDRIPGLYHNENNVLYLTLMLDRKKVVGYKKIDVQNNQTDITEPFDECWGIAQVPPSLVNRNESAIVVNDFKSFLVLAAHKLPHHVICLPHGLRKLPQELLPSLENYNKLILWFENDQIAWNSARTFAKKFVESRCYFIRPVNDQPSPYIAFKQDLNIEKIIKTADKMVHPSIINFSTIRKEVFAELQNHDKALGIKWSNFPILNKTLGGHRRGELTILTGPTGSGKTTFISEYSLDLTKQGLPTLWGSFEIRNQRLGKIMLQQFAKEPIHLNLNLFDALADEFEKLPLYFMTFHGSQPLNTVMDAVLNAAYVYDIGHVVIDNVQFMMGIGSKYNMGSERFWQQDTVIAEFRNFATYTNCHVTLVIHPRKEKDVEQLSISSIFGTAKATQEADNILIIQNKTLESLQIKKYLQKLGSLYTWNILSNYQLYNLIFHSSIT
ncbi:mitochondrial DNA helicase isoform X2 [Daktulosphaira vitifoliae]|uniref:mitochondrial DNA helicase isoform X2 n=1 Tax=Daktulosphaira vitifoliae TaxID=58002 RepID=UPI0021AAB012|nr:mitochondrial DNA helicase isoform X2 [Daktulosphaira vitifoliae]